jgi:hypothetical protein
MIHNRKYFNNFIYKSKKKKKNSIKINTNDKSKGESKSDSNELKIGDHVITKWNLSVVPHAR